MNALRERYRFTSNNSQDKVDLTKEGLTFEYGYWQGHSIKKFSINPSIIYLDGEVSTDASQAALIEILEWARDELGANFTSDSVRRWAYVSDVIFQTDFPLLHGQSQALNSASEKLAKEVRKNLRQELDFQPSAVTLGHDPQKRLSTIAPFSIAHRAGTLFEDNIFFSEAPVPTALHIELLEEIEEDFRKVYEGREE